MRSLSQFWDEERQAMESSVILFGKSVSKEYAIHLDFVVPLEFEDYLQEENIQKATWEDYVKYMEDKYYPKIVHPDR
jgi:hypothetical protein